MTTKRYAILFSAAVLVAVASPAFATTGTDALTVGVSQSDGVVVTVTANGTAVENASVSVSTLNNSTYAGVGSDTTDENGTVVLPTPANNTTVHIAATKGNQSAETTMTLAAPAKEDASSSDGPFGQQISSFIKRLLSGENVRHPGRVISSWVTAHNPGSEHKSDHATEHGHAADHHGNHTSHANGHAKKDESADHGSDHHGNHGKARSNGHGHEKGKKNHGNRADA